MNRENLTKTLAKHRCYLPKFSVKVVLAFLAITITDTITTQIGVIEMGYTEFNLVVRFFIEALGNNWWIFNLFYESILLLAIFYGIRFMRTRYTSIKLRSELSLFIVATGFLINNSYWISNAIQ